MNFLRKLSLTAVLLCCMASAAIYLPSDAQAAGPNPVVIIETSMGKIMVMLYPDKTPVTVENFLKYVDAGFYDGTIFHRVVRREKDARGRVTQNLDIVQGGGFDYPMKRKRPLPPIKNEAANGLSNKAGTIAMARAAAPDSATCEFYFNAADNLALDYEPSPGWGKNKQPKNPGYCVFGKIIRGQDVVHKILSVKTSTMGRMKHVPAKPVFITKAYRAQ